MSSLTVFEHLLQNPARGIEFQSHKQAIKPMRKEQKLVAMYLPSQARIKITLYQQGIACNYLMVSTGKIKSHLSENSTKTDNERWQMLEAHAIRLLSYGKNRSYHLTESGLFEAV
jgi:hypothetical protein